jgi:inhibitor of cysteine peptidase
VNLTLNKIIIVSAIAAIIVMGGLGMYLSIIMPSQDASVTNNPNVKVMPLETPSKFPYQFNKEVFDSTKFSSTTILSNEPIKFKSYQEISDYVKESSKNQQQMMYIRDSVMMPVPFAANEPLPDMSTSMREGQFVLEEALEIQQRRIESGQAIPSTGFGTSLDSSSYGQNEYSATNVQVKNVDEPDYLKTDGKYVYIGTQNTISIIDAYPPESANVILRFALDVEPQNIENMFLNDDRLVLMYHGRSESQAISEFDFKPYPIYNSKTIISILDVSDKKNPKVISTYDVDGNYYNSRMIGNIVYVLSTSGVDYSNLIVPAITAEDTVLYPDVYRFPNPEPGYNFNTITAVDVSGKLINSETFMMGYSNSIFVSEDNLYITYEKNIVPVDYELMQKERFFDVIVPLLPEDTQDKIKSIQDDSTLDSREKWRQVSKVLQDTYNGMSKEEKDKLFSKIQDAIIEYDSKWQDNTRRTVIHKIALDEGNLKYIANNDVPGYPLNQFSMDEHSGFFRIATTSESFGPRETIRSNNVYVLDDSLKIVGKLEKIAPEERIYSARFMGDKLYLVTFKQVDPFFVIDLSTNTPKILGELKIPGFSNYLQPYDENHIIGIGRDTKENSWGGVEQKGIKISMFDVSDFNKPKETDTIVIGSTGTYSDAIDNHKALLLDKSKGIISIPIKTDMASIMPQNKIVHEDYNKQWYGFYVYTVNAGGFEEKGQIQHYTWQYDYGGQYMQPRSFYINDSLYTVMDGSMKINDIDSLDELNSIKIQQTGNIIPYVADLR